MSGNEFVLVCAGRSYKASARLVFRDLGKMHGLDYDLIKMIHKHYIILLQIDGNAALQRINARSTIRAALQRYWMTWIREAPPSWI